MVRKVKLFHSALHLHERVHFPRDAAGRKLVELHVGHQTGLVESTEATDSCSSTSFRLAASRGKCTRSCKWSAEWKRYQVRKVHPMCTACLAGQTFRLRAEEYMM